MYAMLTKGTIGIGWCNFIIWKIHWWWTVCSFVRWHNHKVTNSMHKAIIGCFWQMQKINHFLKGNFQCQTEQVQYHWRHSPWRECFQDKSSGWKAKNLRCPFKHWDGWNMHFNSKYFDKIKKTKLGDDGEIQLIDSLLKRMRSSGTLKRHIM